ncbi:MAG: hypothetical protein RLO81_20145 [Fulvivirga sp.]|uniref:hypothetical protein n=1 Tax=Fulvivirga sp. TaxID=1931237 RepID=UPI0032EBE4F6
MKEFIFFSFLLLAFSCNTSKSSSSGKLDIVEIEDANTLSPDEKYTLVIEQNDSGTNKFSVLKDQSKVYEDSFESGYVKWYDTHRLEIFKTPGIIPPSKNKNDFIIIYDVVTKISKTLTEIEGSNND